LIGFDVSELKAPGAYGVREAELEGDMRQQLKAALLDWKSLHR